MDNKQTFEVKTYLFMNISGTRTNVGVEEMSENDKRWSGTNAREGQMSVL